MTTALDIIDGWINEFDLDTDEPDENFRHDQMLGGIIADTPGVTLAGMLDLIRTDWSPLHLCIAMACVGFLDPEAIDETVILRLLNHKDDRVVTFADWLLLLYNPFRYHQGKFWRGLAEYARVKGLKSVMPKPVQLQLL